MIFLLCNNLFIYQVLCTLIYRRRSLYSFLSNHILPRQYILIVYYVTQSHHLVTCIKFRNSLRSTRSWYQSASFMSVYLLKYDPGGLVCEYVILWIVHLFKTDWIFTASRESILVVTDALYQLCTMGYITNSWSATTIMKLTIIGEKKWINLHVYNGS